MAAFPYIVEFTRTPPLSDVTGIVLTACPHTDRRGFMCVETANGTIHHYIDPFAHRITYLLSREDVMTLYDTYMRANPNGSERGVLLLYLEQQQRLAAPIPSDPTSADAAPSRDEPAAPT